MLPVTPSSTSHLEIVVPSDNPLIELYACEAPRLCERARTPSRPDRNLSRDRADSRMAPRGQSDPRLVLVGAVRCVPASGRSEYESKTVS